MRLSLDSARTGMLAASRSLDAASVRVARDSLPLTVPGTGPTPPLPAPARPDDDLVGAVPDLLQAREAFQVNAVSARYADDAYRSVLTLLDR